ncbi:hypothetical protein M569_10064 [Genlisea aurea]|uniref:DUF632 domain-containing protein n=1 Tax=Genlisea aurea TaxID=192259 RepID=S8CJ74_9LAMI|nr:hypothetical protein M569_10064 [Genlisea aurea]
MGCVGSKLQNEDTVRRCRERRRLMKAAVQSRHYLAAAHSDYCRSLRLTGAALLNFASGERFSVSEHPPAVIFHSYPSSTRPATTFPSVRPPASTSSSQNPPVSRWRKPIKVPHILSESSLSSSPPRQHDFFAYNGRGNSTYASTPSQSQASSVWNWDHFYPPPSPPDSEYFNRLSKNAKKNENQRQEEYSSSSSSSSDDHHRNPNIAKSDAIEFRWDSGTEGEREEVQCSEWGDHDNISSTSVSSEEEDFDSRSDLFDSKSNREGTKKRKGSSKFSSKLGTIPSEDGGGNSDRRMIVRYKDLMEIVSSLKEYFDEAASTGGHVSDMLEASRDQLDRTFKQLKKRIYHSTGMLSNLSSTWTSKPPLTVKYQLEPHSIDPSGGDKSLCSTMDRLLAWEKKLYQEVKAREGVKIEHEKKLSALQSQEYRGVNEAAVDKTKTSIKRLQSLILVTSQAVSTTSSAILDLRDSNLVPQLVELCHGLMYMWRSMHEYHEMQNDVVQQVRGLVVNRSSSSTSEIHRQATRDLELAVSAWHSSFCSVTEFHRDFICSLYGWFKLTLLSVDSSAKHDDGGGDHRLRQVFTFIEEWKLGLDRIPDAVASEAIKSFNNVIRSISAKQSEEIKMKRRSEAASRELEKKASSLTSIEKKYYKSSYSTVGIAADDQDHSSHVLDARDPLAEKKAELSHYRRRVEDETAKHSKAAEVTRAMTLNNIQTGLPGLFQALTSFSAIVAESLDRVCKRSYAI